MFFSSLRDIAKNGASLYYRDLKCLWLVKGFSSQFSRSRLVHTD